LLQKNTKLRNVSFWLQSFLEKNKKLRNVSLWLQSFLGSKINSEFKNGIRNKTEEICP
jgi:hypothetical protein